MSNYIYYQSDSPKNIIMATSNYAYHQIYTTLLYLLQNKHQEMC